MDTFSQSEAWIIAEVGNNHQGSPELAERYIREFAAAGADAVKFQTRNNRHLFTANAYDRVYNSENSFGQTYGAHREAVELPVTSLPRLKLVCDEVGVEFMSTPFDEPSVEILAEVGVKTFKIASFDIGNIPFIKQVSLVADRVVISTGGGDWGAIMASCEALAEKGKSVALLHCVSKYPCPVDELALGKIPQLIEAFPQFTIGLSDHFNGILSGPVGYILGARVFEKHVTLDRSWKGTDHAFSLEIDGFRRFCRDIRRVPDMTNSNQPNLGSEDVFNKLGKTLFLKRDIAKGELISSSHLCAKIDVDKGVDSRDCWKILKTKMRVDLKRGDKLSWEHLT